MAILTPVSRVSWSATGLPSGCAINTASGEISGTPTTVGDYTVNLTVENNWGTASGGITIHVKTPPTRYVIRRGGSELTRVTLRDLKRMISEGTLEDTFQIGDQLILTWTDPYSDTSYECPMNFGTFKNFTLADDNLAYGLGLQAEYALPVGCYVPFDEQEPGSTDSGRKSYGNNRWSVSNVRQWLNKAGTPWYTAQHEADAEPKSYNRLTDAKGFLDTFPAEFVEALTPVKNATQTISDDGGVLDVTLDTFFLLSTHEIGYNPSSGALTDSTEGTPWELWQSRTTSATRRRYAIENHSNGKTTFLRNIYSDTTFRVWEISDTGDMVQGYPSNSARVTPACVLCAG